jgi:hypothetical protein
MSRNVVFVYVMLRNDLKEGDSSSPLRFNPDLYYAIRKVQVNQKGIEFNVAHKFYSMLMLICYT